MVGHQTLLLRASLMTVRFSDFYNCLEADPAKRGKQFEHIVNL